MDSGTPAEGHECDNQGSWIPATPFRPIQPKSPAGYVNQQEQEKWLGSDCYTCGCSQGPQAYKDDADINKCVHTWNTTSAAGMLGNHNNAEACRKFPLDAMDGWKNVPCTDLLALANAASVYSSLAVGDSGNSNREMSKYELSIPRQHSYDLNFCLGKMPNAVSGRAVSEFTPITPDKAKRGNSNQVSQLQNSPTDDRTNPERDAQNNEVAAEREPNSIWCNKELFQPHTDTSVAAASTQLQENHNPDKQESHGIDLNKTPQLKPRRKKHRPKVAKEDKLKTPKSAIRKPAGSGKRKYERKKGPNKDPTCSPSQAAGEFIDPKTLEPSEESCRKTLNFDNEGQTREENSTCKSSDLVSESGTKDILERGIQSKSSLQLDEGSEVTTLKPVTPKPAGSKTNPKVKRKYVRRKGLNKDSTSPDEAVAGNYIDPKPPEPTNESCRISDAGQSRDEHSKSICFGSVSESLGNEFSKSELIVDLSKWIEVMTPTPADSKKKPRVKRKYVRKQGLSKDSTVSPTEVPLENNDLRVLKPTKKSCRRTLKFDIEGQHRDEKSTCRSGFDLDGASQASDFYRRGIQSESTVQLNEGIELAIENTQVGIAYDLSRSVNQNLKDYTSLPEGQVPLPTETSPQGQKHNASFRKDDNTECEGQVAANIGQEATKQMMLQIETQQSPGITNESKCNNCTIFIEPGQAWRSKRKYSNAVMHAEASNSNLIGIQYNTLQAYQNPWVPKIHKKKRTEKGQNSSTSSTSSSVTAAKDVALETTCYQDDTKANPSVSKINNSVSTPQWNASGIATLGEARSNLQDKQKTFEGILALTPTESVTKKRSKGLTRVRDLASLTRLAECGMQPTYPGNQGQLDCDMQQVGNPQRPHTCIEALVAEVRETLARKKRTKKRNSFFNSASTSTNEAQKQQKFILYNHLQFSLGALPELTWTRMISIDELTEQLEKLDINRESSHIDHQEQNALVPYSMRYQEQNALVIYNRDGTVVPLHGSFELVKKRRPRPKVDLDEETNRVWKLLLENINSQGIDGTDEENTKWWEEERRVFHGRVDSFIARMHLVQGSIPFPDISLYKLQTCENPKCLSRNLDTWVIRISIM
ncbi:hypothetical protein Pint_35870 [Pistacia integerrima]|uniref:Uncharacterized protein n=1 Tax=Pistacia integerrima TaxID=434235 RepID=A0ACC0Y557_9ROSI|nr:hypothetical protein Pint_35870 [Pistacia integerrima]